MKKITFIITLIFIISCSKRKEVETRSIEEASISVSKSCSSQAQFTSEREEQRFDWPSKAISDNLGNKYVSGISTETGWTTKVKNQNSSSWEISDVYPGGAVVYEQTRDAEGNIYAMGFSSDDNYNTHGLIRKRSTNGIWSTDLDFTSIRMSDTFYHSYAKSLIENSKGDLYAIIDWYDQNEQLSLVIQRKKKGELNYKTVYIGADVWNSKAVMYNDKIYVTGSSFKSYFGGDSSSATILKYEDTGAPFLTKTIISTFDRSSNNDYFYNSYFQNLSVNKSGNLVLTGIEGRNTTQNTSIQNGIIYQCNLYSEECGVKFEYDLNNKYAGPLAIQINDQNEILFSDHDWISKKPVLYLSEKNGPFEKLNLTQSFSDSHLTSISIINNSFYISGEGTYYNGQFPIGGFWTLFSFGCPLPPAFNSSPF